MNLPFKLPLQKKALPNYYLALLLREEKATAVIFKEDLGKVQVIGESDEPFKNTVEQETEEDFLNVLDRAISKAESSLPQDVETQKTIFGLKETWIEDTKIKKEYLGRLKKASDALGLDPIGFLVIHEAIAHLLQKEEGAPVSAILIELGREYEVVSLLRAGRIIETHRAKIEDGIPQTTDRLLHHFQNTEVLPARIILFNENHGEDLQQKFISHTWSKSLPFLHVPQITVLPNRFDARAMLFGAAAQMGFDVLGTEANIPKEGVKQAEEDEDTLEKKIAKEKVSEYSGEEKETDFGFVVGKDIRAKKIPQNPLSAVTNEKTEPLTEESNITPLQDFQKTPSPQKLKISLASLGSITTLLSLLQKHASKLKKANLKLPPSFFSLLKKPRSILAVPIIVVIFLAILLFYFFGTSATVTLLANAQTIEQKQDVTLSQNNPTDPSTKTLAMTTQSVDEQGSVTENATGKKEIGTNAKGSVTLFSIATQTTTFPSGTVIISSNNLKFTFDNSVTIASASAGSNQPTATVDVTASDVGEEYNLPSGTNFSVQGYDSSLYLGKNDNAFSGGTKKEVTVVSADDLTKAATDLTKNLEAKAKEDISQKVPSDGTLLSDFISSTISQKDSNKQADDQANNVTLTGTVTYQAGIVKTQEAKDFANNILQKDTSNEKEQNVTFSFENISTTNDTTTASFVAQAILLPQIDENNLAQQMAGKSLDSAKNIATQIPHIENIAVKISPSIPLLPKTLPRISSHIKFIVAKE